MTVDASQLAQYEGKRISIVYTGADGTQVTAEGKAEKANEKAVLLKPKGKTNFDLIEADKIQTITVQADEAKPLTAKTLKPVVVGASKTHLLERHGLTLGEANGLTEEAGLQYHSELDHAALDLGHVHGVKASAEKAAALEEKAAEDAAAAAPTA